VALEQEKTSNASAIAAAKAAADEAIADFKARADANEKKSQVELAMAKEAAAESERKLAAAHKELDEMKAAREVETGQDAAAKARTAADVKKTLDEMAQLKEAGAESEKILAAANKELELLRSAHPPQIQIAEGAKQIPDDRDQLKQLMAEVSKDETEIVRLKSAVADGEGKLAAANSELETLKTARPSAASPAPDTKAITEERDKLKDELAERSRDLANAEAHHSQELLNVRAALLQAEQRRDELEKKLASVSEPPANQTPAAPAPASPENSPLAQRVEQLQARIAVLEAGPVPYNADELALLKKSPPPASAEPPKAAPRESSHIHSVKDLPPGSGPLWDEALRACMAGDYATAEQKYNEVLRQDETNVYVLAFLANVQFAAGHLADCEKSVQRALAVDSEDPGSLYLLGLLRYRQDRLDEALDALSLSAKFNPTNAATENTLGCVLADKGFRPAAETAMRKALQSDPDYADAHFNLAVVYSGNQPPSLELARWHYKRAMALGHAKSPPLEKLLAEDKQTSAPGQ
jgi:Tfp pilus assembly protein PilF/chromosome segregation ATPase